MSSKYILNTFYETNAVGIKNFKFSFKGWSIDKTFCKQIIQLGKCVITISGFGKRSYKGESAIETRWYFSSINIKTIHNVFEDIVKIYTLVIYKPRKADKHGHAFENGKNISFKVERTKRSNFGKLIVNDGWQSIFFHLFWFQNEFNSKGWSRPDEQRWPTACVLLVKRGYPTLHCIYQN